MNIFNKTGVFLGRKSVLATLLIVTVVIVVAVVKGGDGDVNAEDGNGSQKPVVTLITSAQYSGNQSLSLIGNARAFSEANITAERGGRVTNVNVKLGDKVSAGQIVATLENSAERASVLQAEGFYDSAVAASAQSGVSVDDAKNNLLDKQNSAVQTLKSAYNTTNGIVLNSIDSFFANPNSFVPGLRIDGKGNTATLNSERVAFQTLLPAWKNRVDAVSVESNLESEIDNAKQSVERTISMVDTFITVFNNQDNIGRYTDEELMAFSSQFTGLRASLIATQSSLDAATNGLRSAREGLKRAELASSGGTNSAADAQIKQALGSLRAAQANLAKTILRTPISGTINSLNVRSGDFIGGNSSVAIVANNSALEIVTYISDSEQSQIAIGDEVTLEGNFTGKVTQIAPAVSGTTGKIEVRIATENTDIKNGDTVRITKEFDVTKSKLENKVIVPLTAVKFERENGSVFMVTEGKLAKKSVELGNILGSSVEVVSGLDVNDQFVQDVRGLVVDEAVTVAE
ncbi:HlyD family efflux transporter periplasmic adaptor subunit [Candidatus Nomurabacteria bacterium]|nr:HlyD family efflux transporter periplasmic adaptor subunit [Candidatus Nomurabacteria bacterium]